MDLAARQQLNKMISQNWFKVRLNEDGTITGRGNFSNKSAGNFLGLNNALNTDIALKFYPPMIAKIERYIARQSAKYSTMAGSQKTKTGNLLRAANEALKRLKNKYQAARDIKAIDDPKFSEGDESTEPGDPEFTYNGNLGNGGNEGLGGNGGNGGNNLAGLGSLGKDIQTFALVGAGITFLYFVWKGKK